MTASSSVGTITLDYSDLDGLFWQDEKPKIANVSGAAADGGRLWTASDEGSSIECLTAVSGQAGYATALSRDLFKLFPGFAPFAEKKRPEVDLEALALDGRRLWLAGAHCWADRNGTVETDKLLVHEEKHQRRRRARTLLGFLELDGEGKPRRGLCLLSGDDPGGLLSAIAGTSDACLKASLMRFSKRGGLDIEGLAVRGDTLLIGLRGPVCDGAAIVLRAKVEIGAQALAITTQPVILRLELGGRGIRDLLSVGDDVLVLAGPAGDTQDAPDKRFTVHRWTDPWRAAASAPVPALSLPQVLDLTPDNDAEKPEGLALLPGGRLLVVHDGRAGSDGKLACDLYELPS